MTQVIAQHEAEATAAPEVQDDFDLRPEEEQALDIKDQPEVNEGCCFLGGWRRDAEEGTWGAGPGWLGHGWADLCWLTK